MTNCLAVQPKVQFNIRSRKNLLQKKKKTNGNLKMRM